MSAYSAVGTSARDRQVAFVSSLPRRLVETLGKLSAPSILMIFFWPGEVKNLGDSYSNRGVGFSLIKRVISLRAGLRGETDTGELL